MHTKFSTKFHQYIVKRRVFGIVLLLLTFSLVIVMGRISISFVSAQSLHAVRTIVHRQFHPVCGAPGKGMARCHAHVITDNSGSPLSGNGTPLASSYGPAQFHEAYALPCTPGGTTAQSLCPTSSFGGQTIAIVDAYNASTIASDLNTYDSYYGLPACTQTNGCLTIVNENGGSTLPTNTNSGWALETSLDVETAHMICQTCKILLVEANASYYSDLSTAVATAARLGATEISNSYGGTEWSGETAYDAYYAHPGIAVTASSGDSGYGAEFPASSPYVVAVGGTTLQLSATSNSYAGETVWSGSGSGCSAFESANSWQKILGNWSQTNCGANRAVADVSADADPNTGAAVYDSTPYGGTVGWYQVGGTSLASPLIAGVYALANGVPANTNASSIPYLSFTTTTSHDITVGSNGTCGTIMCTAGVGFDGPSGLGSPNGINGFSQSILSPTPTGTVTPTPTNTPTPTPVQTLNFGYTTIGNQTDVYDENYIDGSRFRMGNANGTLTSISVYVASVDSSPHDQYQVALYSDTNGKPGTLLAKSATGTLIANNWNKLGLSTGLHANAYYWLVYNTNSTNSSLNELKFTATGIFMGAYSSNPVLFGTWPQAFTSTRDGYEYSMYATYTSP